jgi:ATP-dependent RNA helicase RhlB
MKFTELSLPEDIQRGIRDAGFSDLMPVQEETLKQSLKGKDVAVQSQTGTGKTAAFLITIFYHFLNKNSGKNRKALIVTPTRELAIQIEQDAKLLGKHLNLSIGSFYGGVGYFQQEKLLKQGTDMIIGTPGRLLDFNDQRKVSFKDIGFLVIDEADRMFDMGFLPDIRKIIRRSSSRSERQTMLFSATLDIKTSELAREFMNDPVSVRIRPQDVTVDKITQVMYHVSRKEKINFLLGVLKKEAPKNALIFTNMKLDTVQVAGHLNYNGYRCQHISGDLNQKKRLSALEKFKSGEVPFLVATDVAARGLHIEDLEMIINYDLPGDSENYVHRIGRTARAGKSGKAITIACDKYIPNLDAIETFLNCKIPVEFAPDDMFLPSLSQGMRFDDKGNPRLHSRAKIRFSKSKKIERSFKKGKASLKRPSNSQRRKKPEPPRHPLSDRLDYYKRKYGENFIVKPQDSPSGAGGGTKN